MQRREYNYVLQLLLARRVCRRARAGLPGSTRPRRVVRGPRASSGLRLRAPTTRATPRRDEAASGQPSEWVVSEQCTALSIPSLPRAHSLLLPLPEAHGTAGGAPPCHRDTRTDLPPLQATHPHTHAARWLPTERNSHCFPARRCLGFASRGGCHARPLRCTRSARWS